MGLFLAGVGWLGLSGAPDERGFWPILLCALLLGLLLCRSRQGFADAVLRGMSQPMVALMILAWMLAGVLGAILKASGLIEGLVWLAYSIGVSKEGFVALSFLVASIVSTATGTSLGTLIVCSPLLYPAAGLIGVEPTLAAGSILAGATFGDHISPVSDTTIASAMTQDADLGGVVRSRARIAVPAALLALLSYVLVSFFVSGSGGGTSLATLPETSPKGLWMLVAPAVVLVILMSRQHLLVGLFLGNLVAVILSLSLGLVSPGELLSIDSENFVARGLVLSGMEKAVGVSVFTLLLMGLVGAVTSSGILDRLTTLAEKKTTSRRGAELWIFGVVSGAVLLTTHSVVAILTAASFARDSGERFGISPYRRANLLDMTVCTYPFLLPFFIPTILASSMTSSGEPFGIPRVSSLCVGMSNFYSWFLLAAVILSILRLSSRQPSKSGP